jgi:hypothetical protein
MIEKERRLHKLREQQTNNNNPLLCALGSTCDVFMEREEYEQQEINLTRTLQGPLPLHLAHVTIRKLPIRSGREVQHYLLVFSGGATEWTILHDGQPVRRLQGTSCEATVEDVVTLRIQNGRKVILGFNIEPLGWIGVSEELGSLSLAPYSTLPVADDEDLYK